MGLTHPDFRTPVAIEDERSISLIADPEVVSLLETQSVRQHGL